MNFERRSPSKPKNPIGAFRVRIILTLSIGLGFLASTHADEFRLRQHQLQGIQLTERDVATEMRFGQEVAARILATEPLLQDSKLNHYVNLVGASLALNSKRSELPYYFGILDTNELGAYSTPGGYVFITRGLLRLTQDESELAAILAHELAHVTLMHIVTELDIHASRQEDLSGLARLIGATGSATQVAFNQAVDKAMTFLFSDGFRKSQELDADRMAVDVMALTGYDPAALIRILRRIRAVENNQSQRTHPDFGQRDQQLEAYLPSHGLPSEAFKHGRER